ncbi:MAG: hypothetical protein MSC30_11885 [Gaiellaceae bacterium MAG52_C11]|nr:hypothetical protein [Candidatus Gaiellasilicea maunaloa]
MECPPDEIAELIENTLGITGVRAHALGVFNDIYFRVEVSRFGGADARTYLVCLADGDPAHVTSTYMLNKALSPWWEEKPSNPSRAFFAASPCAMDFLSAVVFSVPRWNVRQTR